MTAATNIAGNVNINGTLTLSTNAGGDIKVGGNWTRAGTFNPNSRTVTFNGTSTQTIARGVAGIETFSALVVDKASGNLTFSSSPATSVIVSGSGSALQIINAGGIDLNGNGLTLNGGIAGTNILAGGAAAPATRTITGTGTFAITNGAKSVTNNNSKTLTFGTGVNITLNQGMDFGAGLSFINGTLTISSGGSVNTNPPTYGSVSTLVYDCNCVFNRSTEWSAASGAGYPANVQVNNASGTDLDLSGTTPGTARQMAGNLLINDGGRLLMDFVGVGGSPMTASLTVLGNVTIQSGVPVQNNGSLHLSTLSGGDLHLQGDFTNNGTFTHNNRTVFFEGGNNETVSDASSTLTMPYVRINKSGGTVALGSNLTTLGTSGGDSIQFTGATSTLTLNGKTLTLGSTVGTQPAGSGLIGDSAATLSLQDGGTGAGGAMGTLAFVANQNLGTLTINRTGASASATLGSNVIVNNTLNLTSGDIITGANTLTMVPSAPSTGIGDVVGNVERTGFTNGAHATNSKSFGNPNVQISFQTGMPASDVVVNLAKSKPSGTIGFSSAIKRTYTVTQTGASGFTATFRMHYVDSDLNGSPAGEEALLDLWRFNGTSWNRVNKTGADNITANNKWVESSLVTQFSPWTLSATPSAPTAARLREFKATKYGAGTVLEWNTQSEVDNLGFNIYREDRGGARVAVNSSLVAGSALAVGTRTVLGAGNAYSWIDRAGTAFSRYWLEAIDTNGKSTMTGPYTPASAGRRQRIPPTHQALLLSQLGTDAPATDAQHQWWATPNAAAPAAAPIVSGRLTPKSARYRNGRGAQQVSSPTDAQQRALASGAAVKLSVRRAGWYRVTRAQLEAAGLNPSVDPARLQLYAEGTELPMRVNNASAWQQTGSVEFYGEGLDQTATDTRVYWLVEGATNGRRLGGTIVNAPLLPAPPTFSGNTAGNDETTPTGESVTITPVPIPVPGGPFGGVGGPASFTYTVERRERTIYFSSLTNGETENFFGRVVSQTPATQTLGVRDLEQLDSNQAQLDVSLQGVTATAHTVRVLLNGTEVGTVEFAGREHKAASFLVESWMMREGDNGVELSSAASGDVSLTDYLRLSYKRLYRAEDDALRFVADSNTTVSVSGFNYGDVRVVDVTDPQNVSELPATVTPINDIDGGGFRVTVHTGGSSTPRTLYAFADNRVAEVSGLSQNQPSDWHAASNEADFVIITHGTLRQAVAPLAAKREAEGLKTTVVDVEDLYDEFSYGEHSPQAVKDFLQWTTQNWRKAPRYVLLAGDGSYDPRNYMGRGSFDLVPTKLIDTTLMETASDNWYADFDNDGLAEMSVGRLPVRTVDEATLVVSKIVNHEPDKGGAQASALLVADRKGADGYSFESATDTVQSLLPGTFNVSRINRGTQSADAVRSQIIGAVNGGPAIVNWMGHGSVNVWTGEGLLRGQDAATLQNGGRLPLFVMMTCLNGYYQDPSLDSLSESLLKANQGGALAVWSSTGMTEPEGQVAMNRELYRILFTGTGALRLGDAMQQAKTATKDADVRRTWVLIGDPTTSWR